MISLFYWHLAFPWEILGIDGGWGQEIAVTLHSSEINLKPKQATFNVSQANTELDPAYLHQAQTDACAAKGFFKKDDSDSLIWIFPIEWNLKSVIQFTLSYLIPFWDASVRQQR